MSHRDHIYRREDKSDKLKALRRKINRMDEETLGLQKKQDGLEISQPGDKHEQEADVIARKVVDGHIGTQHITSSQQTLQRKEDASLMAKGEGGELNGTANLQSRLDSSKGSGQALDDKTKSEMEGHMNADLGDVRIHTGSNAHEMNEGINAKAFTHGQDIYFKNGNYNPESRDGKELLAHELAHTQQQKGGVERMIQRQEVPKAAAYLGFASELFKKSDVLLRILTGEKIIKAGETDPEPESPVIQGSLDLDKIYDENDKNKSVEVDKDSEKKWYEEELAASYTPVRLIKRALSMLGLFKDPVGRFYDAGDYNEDAQKAIIDFKKKYMAADAKVTADIDSQTIANLDIALFGKETELLTQQGGKEPLVIEKVEEQASLPGGTGTLLQLAPGEEKIKVYKELYSSEPLRMEAVGNLLATVEKDTEAVYVFNYVDWFLVTLIVDNKTVNGYVSSRNIDQAKNMNQLGSVNVYSNLFTHDELANTSIFSLSPIRNTVFTTGNDTFKASVRSMDAGTGNAYFLIRIIYTGQGFADTAFTDINIYESEMGFDKPVSWLTGQKELSLEFKPGDDRNRLVFTINNHPIDTPMAEDPADNWLFRSFNVYHNYSYDYNWEPAARVHEFATNENSGGAKVTVVPEWAEKKDDAKKGKKEKENKYADKKLSMSNTLAIAYDGLLDLTKDLGTNGSKNGWPSGNGLLDGKDKGLVTLIAEVKKDSEKSVHITGKRKAETLADIVMNTRDDLQNLYTIYIFLGDKTKEQVSENVKLAVASYLDAVTLAYSSPREANNIYAQAKREQEFIFTKVQALSIQRGGVNDARLGSAEQNFKQMQAASRWSGNMLLDDLIQSELLKLSGSMTRSRNALWNKEEETGVKRAEPMLGADQVIGMIDLITVNYLLKAAVYQLYSGGLNKYDIDPKYVNFEWYARDTDDYIVKIYEIMQDPEFSRGYEVMEVLQEFYSMLDSEDGKNLGEYLKGLSKEIKTDLEDWEFAKGIFTTVLAFALAEIFTAGLATFVAAPVLAGTELTAIEIAAAMKTFHNIASVVLFTGFSAALGDEEVTVGSFTRDLVTNFLMFGFLRKTTAFFEPIVAEMKPVGVFLTQQAVALGALQTFAEMHTLVMEQRFMTQEEREKSFMMNLALHFSMQVSGAIMQSAMDRAYDKALSPVIDKHIAELKGLMEQMQASRIKISANSQEIVKNDGITPEQVTDIQKYFELEKQFYDELEKLAPEELSKIREARKVLDQKYNGIVLGLKLQLAGLGLTVPEAIKQSKTFEVVGKDRIQIDTSDLKMVQEMFEQNSGKFEKMKDGLYKATQNGQSIYFEVVNSKEVGKEARAKERERREKLEQLGKEKLDEKTNIEERETKDNERLGQLRSDEELQPVADIEQVSMQTARQDELTRRVMEPAFGTKEANGEIKKLKEENVTKVDGFKKQLLDILRDPAASIENKKQDAAAQLKIIEDYLKGEGCDMSKFDFETSRKNLDALTEKNYGNRMVLRDNGDIYVGEKKTGTLQSLEQQVMKANSVLRSKGINREYILFTSVPADAKAPKTIDIRSRETQQANGKQDKQYPKLSVPKVQVPEGQKPVIVDIGAGSNSFALDLISEKDRSGSTLINTEYEPTFVDAYLTSRSLTWEHAAPRTDANTLTVLGDPLQTLSTVAGEKVVSLLLINNINANYRPEEYTNLARQIYMAMAPGGEVQVQWDMSPEVKGATGEKGKEGSRHHITGPELQRALLEEASKFNRTFSMEETPPIDYDYSITPTKRMDATKVDNKGIDPPNVKTMKRCVFHIQ